MAKIIIRGQMVRVAKIEDVDIKNGDKAGQKLKIAYFTVADRDRHPVPDGKGGKTYESDAFYFCKAVGNDAKLIDEFFNKKDANGKLISRKIYLEAEPKQYENSKDEKVELPVPADKLCEAFGIACPDNLKGKNVKLEKSTKVKYNDYVFEVKKIGFEDANPEGESVAKNNSGSEVKISLDGVAAPAAATGTTSNFDIPSEESLGGGVPPNPFYQ